MEKREITIQPVQSQSGIATERPLYETPRIQEMSEADILNSFQITQSMSGWWATM